ncbi:MAG: hypothetical protein ABW042_01110, partial [Phenylobacterium sp.]
MGELGRAVRLPGPLPVTSVVIGLSAVIIAIRDGEVVTLAVRPRGSQLLGLPFGPFDPGGHRTFEL